MKYKRKWYDLAEQEYKRKNSGTPGLNFIFKSIFRNYPMMRSLSEIPFRVLLINDADNLTVDIQQALRRTLEKSTRTCRFCLVCENLSKIIDPIRSRFVILHFNPLSKENTTAILRYIISTENITITDEALSSIVYLGQNNMIRTINLLQAVSSVYEGKAVDADSVHKVAKQYIDLNVREMIALALNKEFSGARQKLRELFVKYGLIGNQITDQVRKIIIKLPIPEEWKVNIFDLLGEYELRIQQGANEEIQLSSFLAQLGVLNFN